MRIPQIKTQNTQKVASKIFSQAGKTSKKALSKEKSAILEREAEKRKVLAERELKILPELNILGLPKWM